MPATTCPVKPRRRPLYFTRKDQPYAQPPTQHKDFVAFLQRTHTWKDALGSKAGGKTKSDHKQQTNATHIDRKHFTGMWRVRVMSEARCRVCVCVALAHQVLQFVLRFFQTNRHATGPAVASLFQQSEKPCHDGASRGILVVVSLHLEAASGVRDVTGLSWQTTGLCRGPCAARPSSREVAAGLGGATSQSHCRRTSSDGHHDSDNSIRQPGCR